MDKMQRQLGALRHQAFGTAGDPSFRRRAALRCNKKMSSEAQNPQAGRSSGEQRPPAGLTRMQYIAQQCGELEAIMSEALAQTIEERAPRPGQRFAELVKAKDTLQHAQQQQQLAAATMVPRVRRPQGEVDALRESIVSLYGMLGELHATLDAHGRGDGSFRRSTSRRAFLLTLKDLIGPMPDDRTWREEWPMVASAIAHLRHQKGHRSLAALPAMRTSMHLDVEGNTHLQIESILQVEGQPRAPSCAARPQTALVSTACAQRCGR